MALAGEDLWVKFDWSLDKLGTNSAADSHMLQFGDEPAVAAKNDKSATGRSLLIVNNSYGLQTQRLSRPLVPAPTPVKQELSRVPDIRDLIGDLSSGGGVSGYDLSSSGASSCDLSSSSSSCLDDLADLNMDGGIDMEFDDDDLSFRQLPDSLLLLNDEDSGDDPLRRDCMWTAATEPLTFSGISSCSASSLLCDQLLLEQLADSCASLSCSPSSAPSSVSSSSGNSDLSDCFAGGTALSAAVVDSEEEEEEETSSDAEDSFVASDRRRQSQQRSAISRRKSPAASVGHIAHSDHSYIATSSSGNSDRAKYRYAAAGYTNDILTPDESSSSSDEEDGSKNTCWRLEPRVSVPAANQNENEPTFRVPLRPVNAAVWRRTEKTMKEPAVKVDDGKLSPGKFRFRIKFKPGKGCSAQSRSILRGSSGSLVRTSYTRRRDADAATVRLLKNAFYPTSLTQRQQQQQPLQISQTKVFRGEGDNPTGGWTSASHRLRGDAAGGVVVKRREVRDLHNSLERQRRVDLKNAFDTLKICVPEIAASDKASKLLILNKARDFCVSLGSREAQLRREKERQRIRHETLARQVRQLQRAAKQ